MSNSLREQMLKAGLVDEKKVKALDQQERLGKRKQKGKAKQKPKAERRAELAPAAPDSRKSATAALKARADRDRDLNRARQMKEEKRALKLQIADIIGRRRHPRKDGEIAYNFLDGKKVKHIYVTRALRDGLGAGRMDIVRHGNGHEVVDAEVAEKLRALDPKVVVARRDNSVAEEEAAYADHPIPDDLDW
ncbi:MAG TPA: DUF2058 domain-containing protein [Pseudomonadales bacterium]|nr:DUF2058 domain-containing protein [Pseudomonadales bacterium]